MIVRGPAPGFRLCVDVPRCGVWCRVCGVSRWLLRLFGSVSL